MPLLCLRSLSLLLCRTNSSLLLAAVCLVHACLVAHPDGRPHVPVVLGRRTGALQAQRLCQRFHQHAVATGDKHHLIFCPALRCMRDKLVWQMDIVGERIINCCASVLKCAVMNVSMEVTWSYILTLFTQSLRFVPATGSMINSFRLLRAVCQLKLTDRQLLCSHNIVHSSGFAQRLCAVMDCIQCKTSSSSCLPPRT